MCSFHEMPCALERASLLVLLESRTACHRRTANAVDHSAVCGWYTSNRRSGTKGRTRCACVRHVCCCGRCVRPLCASCGSSSSLLLTACCFDCWLLLHAWLLRLLVCGCCCCWQEGPGLHSHTPQAGCCLPAACLVLAAGSGPAGCWLLLAAAG